MPIAQLVMPLVMSLSCRLSCQLVMSLQVEGEKVQYKPGFADHSNKGGEFRRGRCLLCQKSATNKVATVHMYGVVWQGTFLLELQRRVYHPDQLRPPT